MALDLFADSTEHYRWTGNGIDYIGLKWTENVIASTKTGIIPDGSGKTGLAIGAGIGKTMTYQNTWWTGFRVYFASSQGFGGAGQLYQIGGANLTPFGSVTVEHDATVSLRAGNGTATLLFNTGSLNPPITLKGFTSYYIEVFSQTSGGSSSTPISVTMELKINGVVMGTGSYSGNTAFNTSQTLNGQNTANYHQFTGAGIVNGVAWMRDFYISANGSAPYGDVGLGAIFPYSTTTDVGWAPVGAATLFGACNPQYPDINDDTIYITDNNPGDKCDFLFGPLTGTDPIPFVHFGVFHRKDAEGSRTFAQTMGGVDQSPSPYIAPGDDYRYDFQGFESPPGGGSWTVSNFNATSFGVDIKT
jgi:hypothetical protein